MRLKTVVSLFVVALMAGVCSAAFSVPLQQKSSQDKTDSISGEWDVSFELQGTTVPGTFKLKLDGDKVTGTAESAHTGVGTLSNGSWVDNKLKFTLDFAAHESIAVTGRLKDGELLGEFTTEGMQGKWVAKKKQ
jgi:hypothetical protein